MAAPAGSSALTVVGRRLEAAVGTYEAALVKRLVTHRLLGPLLRYSLQAVLSLAAAEVGARAWNRREELIAGLVKTLRAARRRAASSLQDLLGRRRPPEGAQGDEAAQRPGVREAPDVLQPSVWKLFASEDGSVIWKELTVSVFLTAATAFMMIRKAFLLGRLIGLQNDAGQRSLWRWYAWQFPLNALIVTLLQESSGFLHSYTVLKWRQNATRKIHDLYFSNMGYYRLHNSGKELEVEDPDIRICSNINEMCQANAGMAFSLCNACVFTACFGQAVIRGRDWKWSLLTPVFFFTALKIIMMSEPEERWALWHRLESAQSRYSQLLTRMQLHAERICMLQGEKFEMSLLKGQIEMMYEIGKQLRYVLFKRNVIDGLIFSVQSLPSLNEQMGWFMGSIMGANDVIAGAERAGMEELLPMDPHLPHLHSAGTLGVIVNNLWAYLNTCSSWGTFTSAYFTMQNVDVANIRVKQLYASLVLLRARGDRRNEQVFLDQGPVIAFDGVSVLTPTGQALLHDLSFKVDEGQSLLICGHNGSGKSSIIRCLCALWPVPNGKITRPGGASNAEDNWDLHKEMYYLPQKPCNVLGSLSDQLTYPEKADLPEEELRRWLRYVDLEHLTERGPGREAASRVQGSVLASTEEAVGLTEEGQGQEVDWELLLSLGEQQALSIARMLYHRPRFAVLDECTSAVGKSLERRLFQVAREIGTTCISITHRPALKEHHDQMLTLTGRLAADGRGWRLEDLVESEGRAPMRPRAEDPEEVHRRLEACLAPEGQVEGVLTDRELEDQRSEAYARLAAEERPASAEDVVRKRWPSSLRRFCAVMGLSLQDKATRRQACRQLLLSAVLLRCRWALGWRMWRGQVSMASAGICGDKTLIFCEFFANIFSSVLCVMTEQWFKIEVQNLSADLWRNLANELQGRMARQASLLEVMSPQSPHVPAVENPIQRLTELKRLLDVVTGQFISITIPMSQALCLLPTMIQGVGLWAPLLLAANYLAFRGAQLFAPDFAKIQSVQNTLESRFQVLHTRLKTIAEPVAFSGAGAAERRIIEPRFDAIMRFERKALRKSFWYHAVVQYFTDYSNLPMWTHRLMAIRYVSHNNPNDSRGLTPANVVANVLFDRSTQFTQIFVQRCVMFMPAWRRLDAHCLRVLELAAASELAAAEREAAAPEAEEAAEGRIEVRGADLVTLRGRCLARELAFTVEEGRPALVTGPSASGKSLLGAALLGLRAPSGGEARVSVPGALGQRPPLRTLMPSPQRVYLPVGQLLAQPLYPERLDLAEDAFPELTLVAYDFPRRPTVEFLKEHFRRYGQIDVRMEVDGEANETSCFLKFPSLEGLIDAIARPQDRTMAAEEFKLDLPSGLPGQPASKVSLVRMRACFRTAGLEAVFAREARGWLAERTWEDVLSGGEQQRLCFARVLYHRPKFALLDECTSMVAADAEAGLYRDLAREWGLTPVTLTQRTFLPDLYKTELSLGAPNAAGWDLVVLE